MNQEYNFKFLKTTIAFFILYFFIGFIVYFAALIKPSFFSEILTFNEFLFNEKIQNSLLTWNSNDIDIFTAKIIFIYVCYGICFLSVITLIFYIMNSDHENFKPIKENKKVFYSIMGYLILSGYFLFGYFHNGLIYKIDRILWSGGLFFGLFVIFLGGMQAIANVVLYQILYSIIEIIRDVKEE